MTTTPMDDLNKQTDEVLISHGWQKMPDGWYLPGGTMHQSVTREDAIKLDNILQKWGQDAQAGNT